MSYETPLSYFQFGDQRPTADQLETMLWDTPSPKGKDAWKKILLHDLLKSQICIDLAVEQQEGAGVWIGRADGYLKDLLITLDYYRRRSTEGYWTLIVPTLAEARLRAAELPYWERAVKREPLEYDYQAVLQAAHEALQYGGADDHVNKDFKEKKYSKIREFMPVLLGARRRHQSAGENEGWIGRLGLIREDCRQSLPPGLNPNWDTGIVFDDNPDKFISPMMRLAVKPSFSNPGKNGRLRPQAYRRAGVVPMPAEATGFTDPVQIVLSCVNEIETLPPSSLQKADILSTVQLDKVTANIQRVMQDRPRYD